LALLAQTQTRAQGTYDVDYTGGTYNQNFDSLPYTNNIAVNAANPITLAGTEYTFNGAAGASYAFADPVDSSGVTAGSHGGLGLSSTMSGWYGSATVFNQYGSQNGSMTKGGIISFGALTNSTSRSLGMLGTSTSGIPTFGLQVYNDTGSTISSINLSFLGELWHQQTAQNPITFGYAVTALTNGIPTGATSLGTFGANFATGASGAVNGDLAANQTNINLSAVSIGSWAPGQALWLTWTMSNSSGGEQGYAIDNLAFSAVPEPSSLVLVLCGLGGLLAIRRRR
jgi:hypothetical protein